jgi:acetoacetyl-[acyl-carrier protein] synthase
LSKPSNTMPLPIIVGCGGINPAGRISGHHAYRRMVLDALPESKQDRTYKSLAELMGVANASDLSTEDKARICDNTLIRRIENFDPDGVLWQSALQMTGTNDNGLIFVTSKRQLPSRIPNDWVVSDIGNNQVKVVCNNPLATMLPELRPSKVTSAGQLPTGFDPAALYASRNHPRGLQMAVYGASDTLRSTGFSVEQLKGMVAPDQFAVYSGSAMGQLDADGYAGLLQNPVIGKRPSSKHCALGLPEMPGDFVNAYVLGSVGETAGIIGACATFLYNVKRGMDDIRRGDKRIVMVGNSEAPVQPHVIEGYRVMGALAEDEELMKLDASDLCDNRRACRPFSSNAGFTVAEASVWIVLMDDELALQHGARVMGSVGDVFVNADGYKKSIPGPGIGNYLTVAKAMASARAILGEEALKNGTYMQAHGTGTPQNRVTESHILNEVAHKFGLDPWLVGAVKCFVGHSMAPAGGDQLAAILGAWQDGWVPGITTIDHIADDVHHDHLQLPMQHVEIDPATKPGAFVNSKGFGGNNATGLFLSPDQTLAMLEKRWGKDRVLEMQRQQESVLARVEDYDNNADNGSIAPIYQFGEGVVDGEDLTFNDREISIPGFPNPVDLQLPNPYEDMN